MFFYFQGEDTSTNNSQTELAPKLSLPSDFSNAATKTTHPNSNHAPSSLHDVSQTITSLQSASPSSQLGDTRKFFFWILPPLNARNPQLIHLNALHHYISRDGGNIPPFRWLASIFYGVSASTRAKRGLLPSKFVFIKFPFRGGCAAW